jgi:ubiquinone/menaquinone biosynthesis C-methylase UbiE
MQFDGEQGMDFYLDTLKKVGVKDDETVLVVCGGAYDQATLEKAGIRNAVISNVAPHDGVHSYGNFPWEYQDAERLTREDGSFDWVIVHAGLHHCASPHQAFCEMLRVARKGVVVLEARDSFVLRVAERFGFVPVFELEPALLNGGKGGGYRDTPIPNYIYRWTEREVEKTVASYDPAYKHAIEYHYAWRLPVERMTMAKSFIVRSVFRVVGLVKPLFDTFAPRQGNCFGIVVRKSETLYPWLKAANDGLVPDLEFIAAKYDRSKYRRID